MAMQPVRGCEACRNARVKCDQYFPICNRCERLRLGCVYQQVNIFRDQNEVAERRVRRAQTRTNSRSPNTSEAPSGSQGDEPLLANISQAFLFPWLKEIPRSVSLTIDDQATKVFFSNYILNPCNHGLSPGYLESLPELLAQSSKNSTLSLCSSAASVACLAAFTKQNEIRTQAYQLYGKALTALSKTIVNPSQAAKDATLMSVLVLDFVGLFLDEQTGPLGPHSQGLLTVLKMRGASQLCTPMGWGLFRVACGRLQILRIMSHNDVDETSTDILDWINMLNPSHIYARLAMYNHEIIRLCHQAEKLINARTQGIDDHHVACLSLIAEIISLNDTLDMIHAEIEPMLEPKQIYRPPEAPRPGNAVIESTSLLVYHDLWLANEWTSHRGFRLFLLEALAKVIQISLDFQSSDGFGSKSVELTEQLHRVISTTAETTDGIITSAPMLAGTVDEAGNFYSTPRGKSVGAFFLLFPLEAVLRIRYSSDAQKSQAATLIKWMHDRMRR